MNNIVEGGFQGDIWPVNPKHAEVSGRRCRARVADLPGVPDLAVIVTPAAAVPGLIAELGALGTRAAVAITAGLTSENGLRQAMLDAARPQGGILWDRTDYAAVISARRWATSGPARLNQGGLKMAFRTILCVTGEDGGDDDVELAARLCGQSGAHLRVLLLALAPPPAVGRFGEAVVTAWLAERQASKDRLEERRAALGSRLAGRGLSAEVLAEYSEAAWAEEAVGLRARYADLTLIGPRQMAAGLLKDQVVEGALFQSGKPLLAVPDGSSPTLRPRRVQVAWDERIEASRAVREALELLAGADEVRLAMVDSEEIEGTEPGADAAAYLARHGIGVSVDRLESGDLSIAETLRRHAGEMSAEMIVMGGYGHSRLRERIFGGVTRSMLDDPPLPVFMAR